MAREKAKADAEFYTAAKFAEANRVNIFFPKTYVKTLHTTKHLVHVKMYYYEHITLSRCLDMFFFIYWYDANDARHCMKATFY